MKNKILKQTSGIFRLVKYYKKKKNLIYKKTNKTNDVY